MVSSTRIIYFVQALTIDSLFKVAVFGKEMAVDIAAARLAVDIFSGLGYSTMLISRLHISGLGAAALRLSIHWRSIVRHSDNFHQFARNAGHDRIRCAICQFGMGEFRRPLGAGDIVKVNERVKTAN